MRALILTAAAVTFSIFAGVAYLAVGPQPDQSASAVVLIIDSGHSAASARTSAAVATDGQPQQDSGRLLSLRDAPDQSADTEPQVRTADDRDIEAVIAARLEAQSQARREREAAQPAQPAQPDLANAEPETPTDEVARDDEAPSPFDNLTTVDASQQVVSVTQMLAAQVASDRDSTAPRDEAAAAFDPPADIDSDLPPAPEDRTSGAADTTVAAATEPSASAAPAPSPEPAPADETAEARATDPANQIGSFLTGTEPAPENTTITTAALPSMPARRPDVRPRARIGLIIRGLGVDETVTRQAVERLPREIALAFVPYGNDLPAWAKRARDDRHEVLVQIPLEPADYPTTNPGPHTLLTSISTRENLEHLDWLLDRFEGITGVTNYLGEGLAGRPDVFGPILLELKARGLVYIDDGKAYNAATRDMARQIAMPYTVANIIIDSERSPEAVRAALDRLAQTAKSEGSAIGIGHAFPDTLSTVQAWLEELDPQEYVLLPVRRLAGS